MSLAAAPAVDPDEPGERFVLEVIERIAGRDLRLALLRQRHHVLKIENRTVTRSCALEYHAPSSDTQVRYERLTQTKLHLVSGQ